MPRNGGARVVAMAAMVAATVEIVAAMTAISPKEATLTHPALAQRLQVITVGWTDGGGQGAPKGLKLDGPATAPPAPGVATPPVAKAAPGAPSARFVEAQLIWKDAKLGLVALARTPVKDLEARLGLKLLDAEEAEDIDTLGGLVFAIVGRIPARGEVVRHGSGVEFEVLDADPRRVKKLKVHAPRAGNGAGQSP